MSTYFVQIDVEKLSSCFVRKLTLAVKILTLANNFVIQVQIVQVQATTRVIKEFGQRGGQRLKL